MALLSAPATTSLHAPKVLGYGVRRLRLQWGLGTRAEATYLVVHAVQEGGDGEGWHNATGVWAPTYVCCFVPMRVDAYANLQMWCIYTGVYICVHMHMYMCVCCVPMLRYGVLGLLR